MVRCGLPEFSACPTTNTGTLVVLAATAMASATYAGNFTDEELDTVRRDGGVGAFAATVPAATRGRRLLSTTIRVQPDFRGASTLPLSLLKRAIKRVHPR